MQECLILQFVVSAIVTIYMFCTMLFTTLNRYFHPTYRCVTRRARMVAGRRRWSATSDQTRRWYTEWRQQQLGEDVGGKHWKIGVSPIPAASNPPQGEAVHYTGGSLRGETSRDVMDTHLPSNSSHTGKYINRNRTQNISHIPPNNDHKVNSNSRNGSQNINGGHEMGYDVRCTRPNRRYTWH